MFAQRKSVSIMMTMATLVPALCLGGEAGALDVSRSAGRSDTLKEGISAIERSVVDAENTFGFELFREISDRSGEENVFISPLSVAMALGMTYNGAGGTTAAAMKGTLELGEIDRDDFNKAYGELMGSVGTGDPEVRFEIANSIWYREGLRFKGEFLGVNERFFNAEVRELDFGAANAANVINKWVSDGTNSKIREIVSAPIPREMVMMLINAIYFKGTWTYEFDERRTKDDFFTLLDGSKKKCEMMVRDSEFDYLEGDEFQAIELPYGDGRFRATVLLPREGVSVDSLISGLNEASWRQLAAGLRSREVIVELPKFTLEYELSMNAVLNALGMGVAFDPNKADFSRMYDGPEPLSISEVRHKTFVQVDEEGTEAAAVTSVGIVATSIARKPRMRVDRPFVFAIRDSHSEALLFIGKIVEPIRQEE